ncbi:MAE_28990/MAE_18760 family HEPN-like nuclease [Paenarthrobacter sp. AB444]|uniref:MAE_28990/MAE_18760 family HEPN-like nuclease n=1 Tax=Paenarthrobacter sp. AB444 TaxID=3025681 RepID=UPI0023658937|nr:HEPN domain-containing protein [Paenarthrobacter sp. AB444]MDD7835176.1 HEPN domain-containing protein [Paenarthrobacter sp. AB444]
MSYPAIDASFRDFEADLSRARRLLEFIIQFHAFASTNPPEDSVASWPSAQSLLDLSKPLRTDLPILSGAILLYLAGRFEFFVRQTVEAATDYLVEAAETYEQLPDPVRRYLHNRSLDVARDPSKFRLTELEAFDILTKLVEREKPGSEELQVDSWLISYTDSNMRPDVLDDVLKRIGLADFWTEVGKQTEVKLLFENNSDGMCKQEARKRLSDIMNERNDIAHPTGNIQFSSAEEILQKGEFLRLLGGLLKSHVILHLRTK